MELYIRIILFRVLFASWMIPLSWVLFPLVVLFSCLYLGLSLGWKSAVDDILELNKFLWNGLEYV